MATLSGLWQPKFNLKQLFYGTDCVEQNLLSALPDATLSKAYIITGNSIAKTTPLLRKLETLLGDHHAGTIAYVRQHGPLEDVELAIDTVLSTPGVDTLISVGGGSPIDTAKVISYRAHERTGTFLTHIAIPTTLSAAECTAGGGYTTAEGVKVGFRAAEMGVSAIFYDAEYARYTPRSLWLSTGMRALDHAVECMYHPTAAEVPWKALSLWAVGELFGGLRRAAEGGFPEDKEGMVGLMVAAYASSGLKGENIKGGMGLSHSLGHALGSPYGIPHGITSCLTLGKVVKLKARESEKNARQIARLWKASGGTPSGDDMKDALNFGDAIAALVRDLGFGEESLTKRNVSKEDVPLIAKRALGGVESGAVYDEVQSLVRTLF